MESIVTVIVPSYNRAHLLSKTIPTYIQEGVKELIIVDDCSPDNTREVVKELQKVYPQIKYIRQPQNMKQTVAKNRGLEEVRTEWVYFGDDDSLLYPGTIKRLYDTCIEYKVEGCGAIAYYMEEGEEKLNLDEFISKHKIYTDNVKDIVDINTMHARFIYSVKKPIVVPFCQACLLMKTDIAKKVKFSSIYTGNAYREETDFILRCGAYGATFMFDSRGAQINLPINLATGGSRGNSIWKYRYDMIINNWRFLKNNYKFMKEKYNVPYSIYRMQWDFTIAFVTRPLNRFIEKLFKYK